MSIGRRFPLLASLLLVVACAGARPPATPAAAAGETPPMIWPKRLQPGDTIMFVAPAGDLDRDRMLLAKERLEARGYQVVMRDDLFAKEGYLAGSDERRAEELMQAFLDPEVDAVFPGTGGYGTMRILDRLDYAKIRAHPKVLVGFSDITGLHLALNRRSGLVTFHSPSPMYGLGSEKNLTPFSEKYFFLAVEEGGEKGYTIEVPEEEGMPRPVALGSGRARGRLVGGNLSLISALEGTPYAIDTRDAILLIEDTKEAPYRVDRMLRQLQLSGKLGRIRGAILGQFTQNFAREVDPESVDPRYQIDGVLRQYFENAGVPVLMNFPLGHFPENCTLPMGGQVEVDADAGVVRVLGSER
ncbi:MAG: LD-carboxypeptidase [Acidobacteria bacterium]|nr:LD-carboxypeptidase [Acidobacteriota bacterium]